MSYETHSPNSMETLQNFSDVHLDPFIAAVFEQISIYNDLLARESISKDRVNEIMNELDDNWRILMQKNATVTGLMSFIPETIEDSEGEAKAEFYEDQEVEFRGVLPIKISGESYGDVDEGNYELQLKLVREGITPDGQYISMHGTAKVSDIVAIEFLELMSQARATKWLDYYHGDDVQDIDTSLLNPSIEECENTLRLTECAVDVGLPHKGDTTMMHRSRQALEIYSNGIVTFDQRAAYFLTVEGSALRADSGGGLEEVEIVGATMAAVNRLSWHATVEDEPHILRPCLEVEFLNEDKDVAPIELTVPIASIHSFTSSRYSYFIGYDVREV